MEQPPIQIDQQPERVVAFDASRKKKIEINLDEPFFTLKRASYPDCSHKDRGVEMDMDTRKVYCKCGVEIDAFDGLLIYAHAESRQRWAAERIEEVARKEAEQKAKRPFVKNTAGFSARCSGKRIIGYDVRLECGHTKTWFRGKRRKHPPRTMTCEQCYRAAELAKKNIAVVPTSRHQPDDRVIW